MLMAFSEAIIGAPVHACRLIGEIVPISIEALCDLPHGVQASLASVQRLRVIAKPEATAAGDPGLR
jgi:hypothetical protein